MRDLDIEFSEKFTEKSGSVDEVETIISKTEEECGKIQEMDSDLEVEVEWTEKEFYLETAGGVHGRTKSAEKIEIKLNTNIKGWQEMLKTQFSHEYGHTYFFELTEFKYESNIENWRHFLLEAHGQHFSEKVYRESNPRWRKEVSREEVTEKWPEIRHKMSEKIFSTKVIGSRDYPLFFGYSTAYYIGERLLEKGHNLENFPELGKEQVISAGNELFDRKNRSAS